MNPGIFKRAIRIMVNGERVCAALEDDFHHFRIVFTHSQGAITNIKSWALRIPFSLCPVAGDRLLELIGQPITPLATDVFRQIDARQQCTHQFDLAGIAIAASARGEGRSYDVIVSDPVEGRRQAEVSRDGLPVLSWTVENEVITSPKDFAGIGIGHGFTDWVSRTFDSDLAEAALVLRRGVFVSRGRQMQEEMNTRKHPLPTGGCWVHQPGRANLAWRHRETFRDFSDNPVEPGAMDESWLGKKPR